MTCSGCDRSKDAAVKTLERLGYTYHGGVEWKPPLGKPKFIDYLRPPVCIEACNQKTVCGYCDKEIQPSIFVSMLLGKPICGDCGDIFKDNEPPIKELIKNPKRLLDYK